MIDKLYKHWERLKNHPELDGVLVRWGILFSLFIIVTMWVVDPYIDWRNQKYKIISSQRRQVSKLIALQDSSDKWKQAQVVSKKKIDQTSNAFIEADSYALAQQKMNELVKAEVEQHQLILNTQNLLEMQQTSIGDKISLQFHLSGKMLNIISFIDAIARLPKILIIEQLNIIQARDKGVVNMTLVAYLQNNK